MECLQSVVRHTVRTALCVESTAESYSTLSPCKTDDQTGGSWTPRCCRATLRARPSRPALWRRSAGGEPVVAGGSELTQPTTPMASGHLHDPACTPAPANTVRGTVLMMTSGGEYVDVTTAAPWFATVGNLSDTRSSVPTVSAPSVFTPVHP